MKHERKDLRNKYKVVSLFSGGGGLDLGFKQAGFNIVWAIDNALDAVRTYQKNIGNHIICADLNTITPNVIPDCDIIIGGPPCQSFSLAGKRKTEDQRGQLIWTYMNIIEAKAPKFFLFENVAGLLSAQNSQKEKILDLLIDKFTQLGYQVAFKLVNAAEYGIPQIRKRVILIGSKNGMVEFPPITHNIDGSNGLSKFISVKEALDDLPLPTKGSTLDHEPPTMSELDKFIVSHVKPGGNYMDIPSSVNSVRIQRLQREGGHTTCYGRMHPDKPSYTINTYFNRPNVGCNIHYSQNRLITIREALRLQSFPDSYILIAKSKQAKNLIVGNAVPPKLAYILAENLKKYIY